MTLVLHFDSLAASRRSSQRTYLLCLHKVVDLRPPHCFHQFKPALLFCLNILHTKESKMRFYAPLIWSDHCTPVPAWHSDELSTLCGTCGSCGTTNSTALNTSRSLRCTSSNGTSSPPIPHQEVPVRTMSVRTLRVRPQLLFESISVSYIYCTYKETTITDVNSCTSIQCSTIVFDLTYTL